MPQPPVDATPWLPPRPTVPRLRKAAEACRGCELWRDATQVVFSAGPSEAGIVLVGEQPGDREDRAGEPFVGPAGSVLDDALVEAGIPREGVYLTNAVKHFRFEQRGKRRIHSKPDLRHMVACAPWLTAELSLVDPDVVVCLGATAGRAVLGRPVRVGVDRGHVIAHEDRGVVVTAHPSAVVRLRGKPQEYDEAFARLVSDLSVARRFSGTVQDHLAQ